MVLFVGYDDINNVKGWRLRVRFLFEDMIVMIFWRLKIGIIYI